MSALTTSEDIGSVVIDGKLSYSERLFRSLSPWVKENLVCLCKKMFYEDFEGYWKVLGDCRKGPFGSYCTRCLLPNRFTLHRLLRWCSACDKPYVPAPTVEELTDYERFNICGSCSRASVRPSTTRKRTNIRIS